jgi:hypothetical protein
MMRIAVLVAIAAWTYFCGGCRCSEKVSHSVETTYRTTVVPWDDKVIDKVDLSVTVKKTW